MALLFLWISDAVGVISSAKNQEEAQKSIVNEVVKPTMIKLQTEVASHPERRGMVQTMMSYDSAPAPM